MTTDCGASRLVIRQAEADEYARVGQITVEAYVAARALADDGDYAQELADAASRAASSELLVAVEGADLVGTVTVCERESPYAEIAAEGELEFRMLAVTPDAQGRGVADALVHACFERARERGDRTVVISVLRGNARAHRLYDRLGFQRVPDRDWEPVPGLVLEVYEFSVDRPPPA